MRDSCPYRHHAILRRLLGHALGDELVTLDKPDESTSREPPGMLCPGVIVGLPVAETSIAVKALDLVASSYNHMQTQFVTQLSYTVGLLLVREVTVQSRSPSWSLVTSYRCRRILPPPVPEAVASAPEANP